MGKRTDERNRAGPERSRCPSSRTSKVVSPQLGYLNSTHPGTHGETGLPRGVSPCTRPPCTLSEEVTVSGSIRPKRVGAGGVVVLGETSTGRATTPLPPGTS